MALTEQMLHDEVVASIESGIPTEALVSLWTMMVDRYMKHRRFARPEFTPEMAAEVLLDLCTTGLDIELPIGATFEFYTQKIHDGFLDAIEWDTALARVI